jgi:hypothetical protein
MFYRFRFDLLLQRASQIYQAGKYAEAITPATEARELARENCGEGHPDFA